MAVRLADLLAGLSRLADLGFGLAAGEALRACALTTQLARSLDLADDDRRAAFYTALLHHVGCTGYAHETARAFGDELNVNTASSRTDLVSIRDNFTTFLPMLTHGRPPVERLRLIFAALKGGERFGETYTVAACEVGRDAARRLSLPDQVQDSVYHVYEHWQGGGHPDGLGGDDIPIASRLARLAAIATLFDTVGGTDLAVEAVRRRAGGMLDPELCSHLVERADEVFAQLNGTDPRMAVLEGEPRPVALVPDPGLAATATVFADLADLKSPQLHGHSRGVASLACGAARVLGLPTGAVGDLEVAGLLHDVGRTAISNAIWEKPGPLNDHEWEQVRLHAYHSERILTGSERLTTLAPLVGRHHERLDARGYHRGCGPDDLSMPARVLAAADAYQAMTQPRAHRAARAPDQAEKELLDSARSGGLDADAVGAVLAAAGHDTVVPQRPAPAGLTDREVEVLQLVAEGCSNARIAERLVISRRTAEHHVQHIYAKIGVSSRAAAALFAMEHGLLESGSH